MLHHVLPLIASLTLATSALADTGSVATDAPSPSTSSSADTTAADTTAAAPCETHACTTIIPTGPPAGWYLRGGGGVEVGRGGIGPSLGLEASRLDERWILGLRGDVAARTVLVTSGADLALQAEAGRLIPSGAWRAQGTLTAGVAASWNEGGSFGTPLTEGSALGSGIEVSPEVGGSLGALSPEGRLWVGLRTRLVSQTAGVGITWGGPVRRDR